MKKYIEKSYLTGKEIYYIKDGVCHEGIVKGIDYDANLLIEENGEETKLFSGEVSVKTK